MGSRASRDERSEGDAAAQRAEELRSGFNMVFSPELVRRLQGEDEADAMLEEEHAESSEADEAARRWQEQQQRHAELRDLARREADALRQVEAAIASAEAAAEETCASEQRLFAACVQQRGSQDACREARERYERCSGRE